MIHHRAMAGKYCPVLVVVQQFLHLRDNNASLDTIISTFWDHLDSSHITDVNIRRSVKRTGIKLDLAKHGITEGRVDTHSLCAGGAMAIKFKRKSR